MRRERRAIRGPAALAAPPTSWRVRALASALTLLMLVVVGLSIGVRLPTGEPPVERANEEPVPAEELVFVPVPASPTAPAAAPSPATAIETIVRQRALPRAGGAAPGDTSSAALPAPTTLFPPPVTRDSARRVTGTAPAVPTPRAVFTPTPCPAPCLERGGAPRTAGGAGVLANGKTLPPLSRAERDSILRGIASAATRARRDGSSGPVGPVEPSPMGQPPMQTGASIPIGLPGGGPTRAQRKRDSTLNADVAARLARVKARADSIEAARRDSLARATRP